MEKMIKFFMIIFIFSCAFQVKAQSIIRIPLHASVVSLDPAGVQDFSSLWVSRQINCQLVQMSGGVVIFDAAESIHYQTPVIIKVKLKKGILFNSGVELTSDDVIATFEYLRKKRTTLRNVFNWIDSFAKIGKYELIIKLKRPVPKLLTVLATPTHAIFEKSFLKNAVKNPELWKKPISCGKYKVTKNTASLVQVIPLNKGIPVNFYLIKDSQITSSELNKYDIVSMEILDKQERYANFTPIKIFDPFQYYFVFNIDIIPWNNRNNRCAFFAKLDASIPMKSYANQVKPARDFIPSGTLGYDDNNKQLEELKKKYKFRDVPVKNKFSISFISSAVEKNFRSDYIKMVKKIYVNVDDGLIDGYNNLSEKIKISASDSVVYALKSNYLDAYEYLIAATEKGPNASGYKNVALSQRIENSQNIDQADLRAKEYREIIKEINDECLMFPLFTMPYETVYVRNNFLTPGIGRGSINEYFLGNVKYIR